MPAGFESQEGDAMSYAYHAPESEPVLTYGPWHELTCDGGCGRFLGAPDYETLQELFTAQGWHPLGSRLNEGARHYCPQCWAQREATVH